MGGGGNLTDKGVKWKRDRADMSVSTENRSQMEESRVLGTRAGESLGGGEEVGGKV